MATKDPNVKLMTRFTKGERISHWVHAVSFFTLLFTGLVIVFTGVQPLFGSGIQVLRWIHRIVGVTAAAVIVLMFFVGNPKYHWEWLKLVFHWGKGDIQHVSAFPKEFFGGYGNYPAQDKFNGGEKINSMFTIFGTTILFCSGMIMWFAPHFPAALVRWMYPVHDLAAFMVATAIIGHMYLALIHPMNRLALSGIINGKVPEKFVRVHYGKWYEQLKKEGKIE